MNLYLSTNRLLTWGVGLFSAYWAFGSISEPIWFSVFASACLFVGGIMLSARTIPDAIAIIKRDQLGAGELAVIAMALIAFGAVWSGAFAIIYSHFGRPISWVGPFSSFGRASIALGFFVLFLSPEATRQGIIWPRWYVLVAAALVIAVVAFLFGYTAGSSTDARALFDTSRSRFFETFRSS